ncbi:MAG: 2'-5' RNA ligase family protein [Erythrobacter sp.]
MPTPFILTASLPPEIQNWAEHLRQEHYPAHRNQLHAHVTLFHSFAPSLVDELVNWLPLIAREFAAPQGAVSGLLDLGTGTAIALRSEQLLTLREMIAEHFHGSLTAQDLYEPQPHITIQNKVTKREARALQADLRSTIEEKIAWGSFVFPRLELHLYKGGPWELVKHIPFRGKERL